MLRDLGIICGWIFECVAKVLVTIVFMLVQILFGEKTRDKMILALGKWALKIGVKIKIDKRKLKIFEEDLAEFECKVKEGA